MNFRLLCALMSFSLFAFNVCGSDSDQEEEVEVSHEEKDGIQTMTIWKGAEKRIDVGAIGGFKVLCLGRFNMTAPYKEGLSKMIIKNLSSENLEISVKVDSEQKLISITNVMNPLGNYSTNVPVYNKWVKMKNIECGIGYGAVASVTFE
ncbi:MAG TPA: hypothetical protein VEL47_04430 [Myxococcota bacterium]|nr:hypothetical protein [Myxococcota bacterium]